MGIRGLTTFIQSRSHLYMDSYELHDTNLVIDGNAIACQLYRWHTIGINDCFGGDYDKYGKVILDFFQLLFDCNITPYVVFDGGYEKKKVATVISRMKNKVTTAAALDSVSEGSLSVFPLFLKDCFMEVVKELCVKQVRCDFEGDSETANIARILNCPVISYDSDFFIFDVLYIPFRTFEFKFKKKNNSGKCYKYIPCEVYRIDKFLNSYGGMDKSNLPLLAVLLGNDYVRRSVFSLFFQNLKIQKCQKNQNEQQRRIKSLIIWLQNETKETAIRKVLTRYKKENRQKVFQKIQNAIQGYYYSNSKYFEYLGIETKSVDMCNEINLDEVFDSEITEEECSLNVELNEESETDTEISSGSEQTYDDDSAVSPKASDVFSNNFRKCVYPPCFMDIISQNRYYCIPQVENVSMNHSHTVSIEILSAVHKILTNSCDNLNCITRIQGTQIGKVVLPACGKKVPHFLELNSLSQKDIENTVFDILDINESFVNNVLTIFPKSWYLFILTITYLINKSQLSWPLIYSLLTCKIILEFVDTKLGFCRNKKSFHKKFASILKNGSGKSTCNVPNANLSEILPNISSSDSINALSKLLIYFEMEEKMKTYRRSFDRNLVHSISQFQSCLLHIKYLNCLLNFPFSDIIITQTLNCTFVYNFTSNLRKRTSCDNYLELLLGGENTIVQSVKVIVDKLKDFCQIVSMHNSSKKKRRKKRKAENTEVQHEKPCEENCCDENLFDTNNKFSLLTKQK